MAGELMTGLSIFKSMMDIAKGLKDINDAAARNSAVIELQDKILSAQAAQMELVERVTGLEKEMARFEAWEIEKQRYELKPIGEHSTLVFTLKEGVNPPEEPHHICANCFNDRKKSILQPEQRNHGRSHLLVCHGCKAEIYTFGINPDGGKPRAGAFGR